MRRPLLASLMVLGLVVTAIGGVGVFAPFTDRATTGPNSVTSGVRPRAADLQLAFPVAAPAACDTAAYSDNTTTAGHTATDAQPGFQDVKYFCLRNVGSMSLTVSMSVIDVVEVDTECTGDEAAAGDTTCGNNAAGELGSVLGSYVSFGPCGQGAALNFAGFIGSSPTQALGTLAAGATGCGTVEAFYPLNRPDTDVLQAQSDKVTWRYAFEGITAS